MIGLSRGFLPEGKIEYLKNSEGKMGTCQNLLREYFLAI